MSCDIGEGLVNELCSFSKLSVTSPTSQLILILQAFRHFTYDTAHSPTLPSLYLRHNSFSNPSFASPTRAHSPSFQSLHLSHSSFWFPKLFVTLPTSQLILQPFPPFTYVTAHSPNPSVASPRSQLILQPFFRLSYKSSFAKLSVTSPTSQLILILQAFRHFTYVTAHSPTLPSLVLRHSSFSQPFRCFTYVTAHSPTLLSLLLRHRIFTYVTWRAAHAVTNRPIKLNMASILMI